MSRLHTILHIYDTKRVVDDVEMIIAARSNMYTNITPKTGSVSELTNKSIEHPNHLFA